MKRSILIIGIIFLLNVSIINPIVFSYNIKEVKEEEYFYQFDPRVISHLTDIYSPIDNEIFKDESVIYNYKGAIENNLKEPSNALYGPMDSPWPMFKYDVRNTGSCPHSTADNPGDNIWWLKLDGFIEGSGVIDNNGIIYFGGMYDFHAFDPINRSIIWTYDFHGQITSSPAIDENGIIYVGKYYPWDGLYALYPNGTKKWRFKGGSVFSSPVIGTDGTIYFGGLKNWDPTGDLHAVNPNGTLKWRYRVKEALYSSPAIGKDGTIYVGSSHWEPDYGHIYAIYQNNGTLKWKYKTNHWVGVSPCVGDDGTVYAVSRDGYLYSLYPNNGTLKWKTKVGAGTHPSISPDGTIYAGWKTLYAIDPTNGSVKWTYDVPGNIQGGTPCISVDGTIYFGTHDHGNFIALNPDGTEKWRKWIGVCEFAPIIDDNGTLYVGTSIDEQHDYGLYRGYTSAGFFYIFNELDPDAPYAPEINGPSKCKLKEHYNFTFKANSPLNKDIYYWIDWGDRDFDGWYGPYNSNHEISLKHRWWDERIHTIRCRVKDIDDRWGAWEEFEVEVTKSRGRATFNSLLLPFLERFLLLERLLNLLR